MLFGVCPEFTAIHRFSLVSWNHIRLNLLHHNKITMKKIFTGSSAIGLIVVLFGVLLLVRNVFNLDIPIFTILLSTALIIGGVLMIRGSFLQRGEGARVQFEDRHFSYRPEERNYSVQFGEGTLNLKGHRPDANITLSVECSFGKMRIIADREVPLMITGKSSFGELRGPDLKTASFGDYTYMSPDYNPSQPGFTINANVSFGELEVLYV